MDLTTTYLGLTLRNPVVAGAGPHSQTVEGVRALAGGGVGAVVLHSLFEEQVRRQAEFDELLTEVNADISPEADTYFPTLDTGADSAANRYLDLVERSVAAVDVPVIASLNGSSVGSWVRFAKLLADAGAAAIELNIYFVPGDLHTVGTDVEDRHAEIVTSVKRSVSVPVAVKLSPYFSSVGSLALRLVAAGADGLVLFNRFLQPEVDVESLTVKPSVALSTRFEGRLPRTWIAALSRRLDASLAATSGVEEASDVVRYLLAGADVVMTTSALVRHGAEFAQTLVTGLQEWMRRKGYGSIEEFRGLLAVPDEVDAPAYLRAGYVAALEKARETYGSLRV